MRADLYHKLVYAEINNAKLDTLYLTHLPSAAVLLKTAHMAKLLNSLTPAAFKWQLIGIQLGFSPGQLGNIMADCFCDTKRCLQTLVGAWLKRITPPPSLQALVAALASESVEEEKLAGELADCVFE